MINQRTCKANGSKYKKKNLSVKDQPRTILKCHTDYSHLGWEKVEKKRAKPQRGLTKEPCGCCRRPVQKRHTILSAYIATYTRVRHSFMDSRQPHWQSPASGNKKHTRNRSSKQRTQLALSKISPLMRVQHHTTFCTVWRCKNLLPLPCLSMRTDRKIFVTEIYHSPEYPERFLVWPPRRTPVRVTYCSTLLQSKIMPGFAADLSSSDRRSIAGKTSMKSPCQLRFGGGVESTVVQFRPQNKRRIWSTMGQGPGESKRGRSAP